MGRSLFLGDFDGVIVGMLNGLCRGGGGGVAFSWRSSLRSLLDSHEDQGQGQCLDQPFLVAVLKALPQFATAERTVVCDVDVM